MVHGCKLACSSSILTHKTGCTSAEGQWCFGRAKRLARSCCAELQLRLCPLSLSTWCDFTGEWNEERQTGDHEGNETKVKRNETVREAREKTNGNTNT